MVNRSSTFITRLRHPGRKSGAPHLAHEIVPVLGEVIIPVLLRVDTIRHLWRHREEIAVRARDRLDLQHPLQGERGVGGPGNRLARDDEAVTTHDQYAPVTERGGNGGALFRADDQLRGVVEIGESLPEEDSIMVEQLE